MSTRASCDNCGGRIDVPADFAKAKIRCPNCGYYADVLALRQAHLPVKEPPSPPVARAAPAPPAKPVVHAKRSVDPRDHRPQFEADQPIGPPLLEGSSDFEDNKPYAVPGTGTKKCRHCRGDLPLDATLCVHCGRDLATGEKTERNFQPIHRVWEEGWPLQLRYQVLAGAQVVNLLVAALAIMNVDSPGVLDLFWAVVLLAFQAAMQAFILGTFDTLTVRRTEKGAASVTRLRRIAFIPLPTEKLPWKQSHAVAMLATHGAGVVAWVVCAYLFTLMILPGVIFYWMVIHPERYEVVLCDVHGATDGVVCRLADRGEAEEAVRVLAEATGLWHKKAM